jgi:myo-inositol catabolism protein IolC
MSEAVMLDAVAQVELDAAFCRVADERWVRILESGDTVAWDDAKTWLEARLRGANPDKPAARKPGR